MINNITVLSPLNATSKKTTKHIMNFKFDVVRSLYTPDQCFSILFAHFEDT